MAYGIACLFTCIWDLFSWSKTQIRQGEVSVITFTQAIGEDGSIKRCSYIGQLSQIWKYEMVTLYVFYICTIALYLQSMCPCAFPFSIVIAFKPSVNSVTKKASESLFYSPSLVLVQDTPTWTSHIVQCLLFHQRSKHFTWFNRKDTTLDHFSSRIHHSLSLLLFFLSHYWKVLFGGMRK